jgi:hypothetical protein
MRSAIVIYLMLVGNMLYAQQPDYNDSLITVKGRVLDTNFAVGFYNLVVVNKSVGRGVFGQYNGNFEITVKKGDRIGVSVVGYQTVYLSYSDSSYKEIFRPTIYVQPLEYTSEEVIVRPLKTLEQLKEERESIAKREVPKVTVTNAIQSPITALYMAFSKREKTKRKVAEMEYLDQQHDIVKEILRLYVHHDIIDLEQEDFEEFIIFLNLNVDLLKYASDYELITYIKQKYDHFNKIREGF